MIIRRLKLNNFQIYEDFEAKLSALTFIKGKNGKGKTTLGVDSIMFCLWGYSPSNKTLTEIPTRNVSKKCCVTLEVEHNDSVYIINREIPTKLGINKDGVDLEFENTTEAQNYIKALFGESLNFKKFRMIDNEVGINFLDPKQATSLKKIIFSISEEIFNTKKEALQKILKEREIWNRDNAVIYHHAPSEKRLEILKNGVVKFQQKATDQYNNMQCIIKELRELQGKIGSANSSIRYLDNDIKSAQNKIVGMSSNKCYACGSSLDPKRNIKVINDLQISQKNAWAKIEEQKKVIQDVQDEMEEVQEMVNLEQSTFDEINSYIQHLNELKMKLEGRIRQKEYKYTTRDLEIAKQAIRELDLLSTKFLVSSVKRLEPIINEVLNKIQYTLEFDINDKGKFDIKLLNAEGVEFKYKDLSMGQKLLLQIAFKLALLLERGEDGLIIADEGLGSLDNDNLLHVLNIFNHYPFQLLFIVHHVEEVPNEVKIIDLNKMREKC